MRLWAEGCGTYVCVRARVHMRSAIEVVNTSVHMRSAIEVVNTSVHTRSAADAANTARPPRLQHRVGDVRRAVVKRLDDDGKAARVRPDKRREIRDEVHGRELVGVGDLQRLEQRGQAVVAEAQRLACVRGCVCERGGGVGCGLDARTRTHMYGTRTARTAHT